MADALPFAEVVADLADLADDADVVVNGVVGFAGLPVTLATLRGGQAAGAGQQGEPDRRRPGRAAAAGHAGRRARARRLASTAPSTSACARRVAPGRELARIVLTASGGPVPRPHGRTSWPTSTVDEALAHPTWTMGPKITDRLLAR